MALQLAQQRDRFGAEIDRARPAGLGGTELRRALEQLR
jgi:hypothetical protein